MVRLSMCAALMVLALMEARAQVAGPGLCERNPDVCHGLQGDDTGGSSGGIGSKKGTGGGGTNSIRPDILRETSPNLPAGPKLPNAPKRFGF